MNASKIKKSDLTIALKNTKSANEIDEILQKLVARHLIKGPYKEGKRTHYYEVNPSCLEEKKP